jgi:hypothetical protein
MGRKSALLCLVEPKKAGEKIDRGELRGKEYQSCTKSLSLVFFFFFFFTFAACSLFFRALHTCIVFPYFVSR